MSPDDHKLTESANPAPGAGAALKIVLVYGFVAVLWILLSDTVVAWLFGDRSTAALVSILKGLLFVGVTALLLYGLIAQQLDTVRRMLKNVVDSERDLRISEGLLLESQQIAGLGSYALNFNTGVWKSSEVCDRVFGIDAAYDRSVKGWTALVHADERAAVVEYFRTKVMEQGQTFDKEYRIVRPSDGAVRWVHGLGQLERDGQGRLVSMRGTILDISDRKGAEAAMDAARHQLQATLDALPDLLFEVGQDGQIYQYHSHRSDLLAAPPAVFIGKAFAEVLPPDVAVVCAQAIHEAAEKGFSTGMTYALALPQGQRWFEISVSAMDGASGPDQHFIFIARDITERKAAEEKLVLAGRVFSHAREGISITDAHGTILDVNASFTRITGYSREEAIGQNPSMLSSGRQDRAFYAAMWQDLLEQGSWSGEVWNRRKGGEVFAEMLNISAVREAQGQTVQYLAMFSDITALKEHQSQLDRIAHFDALTNLPNRLLLADRLQQAMNQAQRRGQQLAVVYLDLDGFKAVNDSHGHSAGDHLLIALAHHLKAVLRDGDTLARMGGDEFVAVLIDQASVASSLPLLTRLLHAAAEPVQLGDLVLQSSATGSTKFGGDFSKKNVPHLLASSAQLSF